MNKYKKGFAHIAFIAIGVVVLLVAVGATVALVNKNTEPKEGTPVIQNNVTQNQESEWKTYKDEKYGFEFKYPKTWIQQADEYSVLDLIEPSVAWQDSLRLRVLAFKKQPLSSALTYMKDEAKIVESREGFSPNEIYGAPEVITIGNTIVIKQSFKPLRTFHGGIIYVFPEKGIRFDISDSSNESLDAILSSLKFTK